MALFVSPRTYSENDCTTVAPTDHCLSPTKGDLVYSKTAKQCLEEISGRQHSLTRVCVCVTVYCMCVYFPVNVCVCMFVFEVARGVP